MTAAGAMVLVMIAPAAMFIQRLRRWRRGTEIRATIHQTPLTTTAGADVCRLDLGLDIPSPAEPGFCRRLTDVVVRIADSLHRVDDVYNVIYRLPSDPEPVMLALGPHLQELGDRFFLVLSQSALAGRTVVWLTLGRERPLAEVVNPIGFDPEATNQLEALLAHPNLRWSMATEWARVGPSLVIRLVLVVPTEDLNMVRELLSAFATGEQRSNV
jgi:hypothetical protein